jgi:hypothetical protein
MEILRALPGPHTEERRAIEDALRALAFLQREEARFDAEAERRVVEESLEKLRSVGHTIQRLRRKAGPRMKPKHIGVVLAVALVFALSSSALGGSKYKVLHEFGGARTGLSPPVRFLLTKREACTGAPTSAERESAATTAAV